MNRKERRIWERELRAKKTNLGDLQKDAVKARAFLASVTLGQKRQRVETLIDASGNEVSLENATDEQILSTIKMLFTRQAPVVNK